MHGFDLPPLSFVYLLSSHEDGYNVELLFQVGYFLSPMQSLEWTPSLIALCNHLEGYQQSLHLLARSDEQVAAHQLIMESQLSAHWSPNLKTPCCMSKQWVMRAGWLRNRCQDWRHFVSPSPNFDIGLSNTRVPGRSKPIFKASVRVGRLYQVIQLKIWMELGRSDANSSSPKEQAMSTTPVLQLPFCFLVFELFFNCIICRELLFPHAQLFFHTPKRSFHTFRMNTCRHTPKYYTYIISLHLHLDQHLGQRLYSLFCD